MAGTHIEFECRTASDIGDRCLSRRSLEHLLLKRELSSDAPIDVTDSMWITSHGPSNAPLFSGISHTVSGDPLVRMDVTWLLMFPPACVEPAGLQTRRDIVEA